LHEEAELDPKDSDPPPETLDANDDIFFFTCWLPQDGQTTSLTASELRNNSSNGFSHSLQTNSKIGIFFSFDWISRLLMHAPSKSCIWHGLSIY